MLPNPCGSVFRVCDEMIDPERASQIPHPHVVSYSLEYESRQTFHVLAVRILVIHVPDIPHGRMAVANVNGTRGRDYSLGRSRFAADDQIVATQIELL